MRLSLLLSYYSGRGYAGGHSDDMPVVHQSTARRVSFHYLYAPARFEGLGNRVRRAPWTCACDIRYRLLLCWLALILYVVEKGSPALRVAEPAPV